MQDIVFFAIGKKLFFTAILMLNIFLSFQINIKLYARYNTFIIEASGNRRNRLLKNPDRFFDKSYLYKKVSYIKLFRWYENSAKEIKRYGIDNENAVLWYLVLRYFLPFMIFLISLPLNNFNPLKGLIGGGMIYAVVTFILKNEKRKFELEFEKSAYKIYKQLYNQVSAGIKVTDAIKTTHEAVSDKRIKAILIRMAARYELSKNIDRALDEIKGFFDLKEAHTLCTAIKLGVDTGDNRRLLERQEDIMFKKYFNYIQAETDSFRMKSTLAVMFFTAVIVIMLSVPILEEVSKSMDKIFIN